MATGAYIIPNTMNKILLGATICDPAMVDVPKEQWKEYSENKRKDEESLLLAISSFHTITGVFPPKGVELIGTYNGREPRFYRVGTIQFLTPDENPAKIDVFFDPVPTTEELFALAEKQQ